MFFKTKNDITTQAKNIEAYHRGAILTNDSRGMKDITAFKFLGKMYVSNPNRCTKYSFDDEEWHYKNQGFFIRAKLVMQGNMKIVHDCKKSKSAGI